MELSFPRSRVQIELEKVGKKNRFKRVFVALKPCIDGFLAGRRGIVIHTLPFKRMASIQ